MNKERIELARQKLTTDEAREKRDSEERERKAERTRHQDLDRLDILLKIAREERFCQK